MPEPTTLGRRTFLKAVPAATVLPKTRVHTREDNPGDKHTPGTGLTSYNAKFTAENSYGRTRDVHFEFIHFPADIFTYHLELYPATHIKDIRLIINKPQKPVNHVASWLYHHTMQEPHIGYKQFDTSDKTRITAWYHNLRELFNAWQPIQPVKALTHAIKNGNAQLRILDEQARTPFNAQLPSTRVKHG